MKLDPFDWIVLVVVFITIVTSNATMAVLWSIFLVLYLIWVVLLQIRKDIYLSRGLQLYQEQKKNDTES